MDEFELDGVHAEIERLAALHQSKKPLYSDRLSRQTPGTEHFGAPADDELTHDDLLAAQRELAEQHGVSSARVRGMVMMTTVRAGLGHSPGEQAAVIAEVALTMDAGKMNISDEQILALSRLGGGTAGLAAEDRREAVRDEAAVVGLTVSAAQRAKFAKSGVAMEGGDYPIHDADHLAAAKREFKKGNFAGHSASEVRAHINKRARALGLPGLDGDEDVAATVTLTQETAAALALSAGQDSAGVVIARHPELAHLFRAGGTSGQEHPSRAGRLVTTKTRPHAPDDEDATDEDQPAKGGRPHRRAAREIMKDNPGLFGDREAATGNVSYPAKSPAQRQREETRALAGGRPQSRITR